MQNTILGDIRKNFKMHSQIKVLTVALIIWAVLTMVVISLLEVEATSMYVVPANTVHGKIEYSDGHVKEFSGYKFETLNKDDTVTLVYNIPLENIKKTPNPCVYFELYNAAVRVYCDDEIIYTEGFEDDTNTYREFTGNRIYNIPLDKYEHDLTSAKTITIEAKSLARRSFSELNACLISASEAWKFPLIGEEVMFVLMISFMSISSFLIVISLFLTVFTRKIQLGVPVFSLLYFLAGWSFSSHRMMYLITNNVALASKSEYYFIIFVPTFLAFFMMLIFKKNPVHKISKIMLFVDIVAIISIFLIDFIRNDFSIQDTVPVTNIILGSYMVIFGIILFISRESIKKLSFKILKAGSLISVVIGVFEVLRYNLAFLDNTAIKTFDIGAFSIMILAITLIFFYVTVLLEDTSTRVGRAQLESMAYTDQLTGLPNRADLDRHLDNMIEEEIKDYCIVFMDVNNLKLANDQYGHEVGDELIKCCANCFQDVFGAGFCCRWGGDEFVAIVYSSRREAEILMSKFDDKIRDLNESDLFEFDVSAAIGVSESTSKRYQDPKSVLRDADQEMYSLKQKMKRFY